MDEYLLFFICLFKITLQKAYNKKITTHYFLCSTKCVAHTFPNES